MIQMTEMIDLVTGEIIDQQQIADQLLAQVKEQGRQPHRPRRAARRGNQDRVGDRARGGDDRASWLRETIGHRQRQRPQRDALEGRAHRDRSGWWCGCGRFGEFLLDRLVVLDQLRHSGYRAAFVIEHLDRRLCHAGRSSLLVHESDGFFRT